MAMVTITRISKGNSANHQESFLREQVHKMCQANNEYSHFVARLMKSGNPFDLEEGMHIRAKLGRACDTTIMLLSRVIRILGQDCKEIEILTDVLHNLDKMYEDVSNAFFDALSDSMDHDTSVAFYKMIGFDVCDGGENDAGCTNTSERNADCCCCDGGTHCASCDEHDPVRCSAALAPESAENPMPAEIGAASHELCKLREQVEKCVAYQIDGKFDPAKAAKLVGKISAFEQRVLILIGKVVKNYPGWENFTRSILCELGMLDALLCDVIEESITKDMNDDETARFEEAAYDVSEEFDNDNDDLGECSCCSVDHAGNEQVMEAVTAVLEQLTDAVTNLNQQLKNLR